MNITTEGNRHLGAALGLKSYRDEYCSDMVNEWVDQLNALCDVAETQPQAYTRGFASKFTYFQRTIPDIGNYLSPIQDIIDKKLILILFGYETPLLAHLGEVFALPVRSGGLGLIKVSGDSGKQFEAFRSITAFQTQDILHQRDVISLTDEEGKSQRD